MRVVLRPAGHELRVRWAGWAVLVLLVAVAGGDVLTAAAGARRTASAYPRFLHASHASDLLISPAASGLNGYYAALAHQPGVAMVAPGVGLNVQLAGHAGRFDLAAATQVLAGMAGVSLAWTATFALLGLAVLRLRMPHRTSWRPFTRRGAWRLG